jgi:hypothetical protein
MSFDGRQARQPTAKGLRTFRMVQKSCQGHAFSKFPAEENLPVWWNNCPYSYCVIYGVCLYRYWRIGSILEFHRIPHRSKVYYSIA